MFSPKYILLYNDWSLKSNCTHKLHIDYYPQCTHKVLTVLYWSGWLSVIVYITVQQKSISYKNDLLLTSLIGDNL